MTPIPKKLKTEIFADPFYARCALSGRMIEKSFPVQGSMRHEKQMVLHLCDGRMTIEHALINGGNQVQKKFALVPLCAKAHSVDEFQDGGDLDKNANVWVALNRATDEEIRELSKVVDHFRIRTNLNNKYGPYSDRLLPLSLYRVQSPDPGIPATQESLFAAIA